MSIENIHREFYEYIIVGANISGLLMATRLLQNGYSSIKVYECLSRSKCEEKTDSVPFYINRKTDIPWVEWSVQTMEMAVWEEGHFHSRPSEKAKINYAEKLLGCKCGTTLDIWETTKNIFVPVDLQIDGRQKVIWNSLLNHIEPRIVCFEKKIVHINTSEKCAYLNDGSVINYNALISTIPLPLFMDTIEPKGALSIPCKNKAVFITPMSVEKSGRYCAVYCADLHISISRIARLDSIVYIETQVPFDINSMMQCDAAFFQSALKFIGVNQINLVYPMSRVNKIIENTAEETKQAENYFMKYNIYLLGRYANWRFTLTEDVWDKTEEIMRKSKNIKV